MSKNFFTKKKIVAAGIALVIFLGAVGFAVLSGQDNPAIDSLGAALGELPGDIDTGTSTTPEPTLAPVPTPAAIVPPASIPTQTPSPLSQNVITGTGNFTADGVQLTIVTSGSYSGITWWQGNYMHVQTDDGVGVFCMTTMEEVVPPYFGWRLRFHGDLAHVIINDYRWGIVNAAGEVIVPFISDVAFNMNYGRGVVRQHGKWGAIDIAGNIYVPLEFDRAGRFFSNGFLNVARNYGDDVKWGVVDIYGREVVPLIYDWVSSFENGFARVEYNGKVGLINTAGEVVIPTEHADIRTLLCGTAAFSIGGSLWEDTLGVIDLTDGRVIAQPIYSMGHSIGFDHEFFPRQLFFEGLAALQRDRKWGFINMQGEEVIPFVFTWATDFRNGLSVVGYDVETGIINTSGEFVIPFGEYLRIRPMAGGLATVAVGMGRTNAYGWPEYGYGVIEIATNREIVAPIYSEIIQRAGGFAVKYGGHREGLWGFGAFGTKMGAS